MLRRFQATFPGILYDLELGVDVANAQAFVEGGRKRVRLYGGLVRHRNIGSAGLATVLAHETGHHLGGPPHLPTNRSLSSEERATEWALSIGLPTVFGIRTAQRIASSGCKQLQALGTCE
ncbi:M56 family metallopeptidase [Reyranella sp. MMS21-HV4-11]|uniref:M56 family metallopeptidase n=1 Tax=Reyranella humidisoli TaxID=2849149 RepID=A0ABS6IHH0_9HYPH|nr:M56 family metallopeptidase [Reyranella sp. MMS21-HV4-11]